MYSGGELNCVSGAHCISKTAFEIAFTIAGEFIDLTRGLCGDFLFLVKTVGANWIGFILEMVIV